MAFVAIDGMPLTTIGTPVRNGYTGTVGLSGIGPAILNGSVQAIGQIWTSDGQSHTIDTTGSSSFGWNARTITLADPTTVVKLGLAAVDIATGGVPPRAVNSGGVITFLVSRNFTSTSAPTANAWNNSAPTTGSMTINNGDIVVFAAQMTARGGTDSFQIGVLPDAIIGTDRTLFPAVTTYTPSTYTRSTNLPTISLTFADGARGYFLGCLFVCGNLMSRFLTNVSTPIEHGNLLQFRFPCRVYGVSLTLTVAGPLELNLYSDPFGTPVAQRTIAVPLALVSVTSVAGPLSFMFSTPFEIAADQPFVLGVKSTSASNVSPHAVPFTDVAYQETVPGYGYGVYRNTLSSAFAADTTGVTSLRYTIGARISALVNPARSTHILGL